MHFYRAFASLTFPRCWSTLRGPNAIEVGSAALCIRRGTSTGTGQATLEGIVPLYFRRLLDASEQDRLPKDVRALTAMPESVVYRVLTSLRYSKGNRSDRSWDQLNRGWDLVLDYVAEDQLSARSARLVAAAAADAGQVGVSTEDNLAFLRKMHKRAATGRYFVEILETLVQKLARKDPLACLQLLRDASELSQVTRERPLAPAQRKHADFRLFLMLADDLSKLNPESLDQGQSEKARLALREIVEEFGHKSGAGLPQDFHRVLESLARFTICEHDIEKLARAKIPFLARAILIGNALRKDNQPLALRLCEVPTQSIGVGARCLFFRHVIQECTNSGNMPFAVSLCRRLQGLPADHANMELARILSRGTANLKDAQEADELFMAVSDAAAQSWARDALFSLVHYAFEHRRNISMGARYLNILKSKYVALREKRSSLPEWNDSGFKSFLRTGYCLYLRALANEKDAGHILTVYNEMRSIGISPDKRTCTAVLSSVCLLYPSVTNTLLSDLERRGDPPPGVHLYTALVSQYVGVGRLASALELLQRMRKFGVSPNVVTYNTIISGLAVAGRFDEIEHLLSRMSDFGVAPNVVTFNSMLDGLTTYGRWDDLNMLLHKMRQIGIAPDEVTFNSLISAHANRLGGSFTRACEIFEEMQKSPYFIRPSAYTYDAFLTRHCRAQDWDAVMAHFKIKGKFGSRFGITAPSRLARGEKKSPSNSYIPADGSPPKVSSRSFEIAIISLANCQELDLADVLIAKHGHRFGRLSSPLCIAALIRAVGKLESFHNGLSLHTGADNRSLASQLPKGSPAHATSSGVSTQLFPRRLARARTYFEFLYGGGATVVSTSDEVNAAVISCFSAIGDPRGGIRWANWVVRGSGTGEASQRDALASAAGAAAIGRASCYALMLLHAAAGASTEAFAVREQLRRFEECGIVGVRETGATEVSEANIVMQVYSFLRRFDKCMQLWDKLWRPATAPLGPRSSSGAGSNQVERSVVSSANNPDEGAPVNTLALPDWAVYVDGAAESPAGGVSRSELPSNSRLQAAALHQRFGVDRVTVSIALDACGFGRNGAAAHRLWKSVTDAGFPLDNNNLVSYAEALARAGLPSDACRVVLEEIQYGRTGPVTPKLLWSLTPLLGRAKAAILADGLRDAGHGGAVDMGLRFLKEIGFYLGPK